jgi:dihydrofolate reductase
VSSWFISATEDSAAGKTGVDVDYFGRGEQNIGATIMGRNMFGPRRGPWEDGSWQGWWGDSPPYHHDVFVHTHYLRPALKMAGGTTFHFTDEPLETVLHRAFDAAAGKDVRIGGGPSGHGVHPSARFSSSSTPRGTVHRPPFLMSMSIRSNL